MPDRNPTLPLYWSLRLWKNCCILLMPFLHCHAHLWGGKKRGGRGKSLGGGEEEKDVDEIWWWMMMRLLYTFLLGGILGAQGKTSTFAFTLCILAFKYTGFWDLALKLCNFWRKIKVQRDEKMNEKIKWINRKILEKFQEREWSSKFNSSEAD
jgi:hypothetical protein